MENRGWAPKPFQKLLKMHATVNGQRCGTLGPKWVPQNKLAASKCKHVGGVPKYFRSCQKYTRPLRASAAARQVPKASPKIS